MDDWHQRNSDYLGASLRWVRLRLGRLSRAGAGGAAAADEALERAVDEAAGRRRSLAAGGPPVALEDLAARLNLSAFERDVLLLCAAAELDPGLAELCAAAQGDPTRPFPTFALALLALPEPSWEALAPYRPLRSWRLVEIFQPGAQPLTTSALRADERIVRYLQGLNYLDDRLQPYARPLDAGDGAEGLPPSQRAVADGILRGLLEREGEGRLPAIQLLGAASASKRQVAAAVCARAGRELHRISADLLPAAPGEQLDLARLWQRESLLMPVALYLEEGDGPGEGAEGGRAAALQRLLERVDGVVFVDRRGAHPTGGRDVISVEVGNPTAAEQREAWGALLEGDAATPARLAAQFSLDIGTLGRIARLARGEGAGGAGAWARCLAHTRPLLDSLAQRVDARATWGDLVLPDEQAGLLRAIAGQVAQRGRVYDDWGFGRRMSRGLGVGALFTGESGTGKTMAAEVLANELRLALYRIDLSQVVSKYIGETEKNLRRVFDAAEQGGAILFFDEADALFGKRSEVKDSHDRYANIEINYLLQRMESYGGLAILATNMKSALDQAFMRRLRFVVQFPFPEAAERRRIWELAFPRPDPERGLPGAPTGALDYDYLARLNLSGGEIHNIALGAAFAAAARGATEVTMGAVLDAARAELRKLERSVRDRDFDWPQAR